MQYFSKIFDSNIFVCIILISNNAGKYSDISISEIKLKSESNPAGIDIEKPDFSWKLASQERNRHQEAYQVVVFSENSKDTFWILAVKPTFLSQNCQES